MAEFTIHEIDVQNGSEPTLRAAHGLYNVSGVEHLPDDTPTPYDEWILDVRRTFSFRDFRRFGVFAPDGSALAYAYVELNKEQNTHLAWGWIYVRPEVRSTGLGRAMLRRIVDVSVADGKTSLGIHARDGMPGGPFLASFGLTERSPEHHNRLLIADLDLDMLRAWVDRAAERASGYSLRHWEGRTPDDVLADFARFTEVMNSAPRDGLEMDDETVSPGQMREREDRRIEAHLSWWTVAAIEDATGAFAGFTQVYFSRWRDEIADQGDTGVDPAHRDMGLGRWMKADMLLRVLDRKPKVAKVDTWNAGSNDAMLGINHALGFAPVEVWGNWQADIDIIRKGLDER